MIDEKKLIENMDQLKHPAGNECKYMLYKDDVINAVNNQQQAQQIVRTPEEIAERLTKANLCDGCNEVCIGNCSTKSFEKKRWLDWLTGKQV